MRSRVLLCEQPAGLFRSAQKDRREQFERPRCDCVGGIRLGLRGGGCAEGVSERAGRVVDGLDRQSRGVVDRRIADSRSGVSRRRAKLE